MKNVKQLIVDTIAKAVNIPLSLIDVDFDVPQALPSGSPRNTKIRVFPKPWVGVSGSYELMYDRVYYKDIRPFTIIKGDAVTVHDVIEEINHRYDYDFELEDVLDEPLVEADGDGNINFYLSFAQTSKGFYSGDRILTSTEYIDPDAPVPPEIDNPNWPYPVFTGYPASGTLLKTICRNNQAWGLYAQGTNGQTIELRMAGSDSQCQQLTLSCSKTQDVVQKAAVINYSFNKPLDEEVNLIYTVTAGTADTTLISTVAYKIRGEIYWRVPTFTNTIVVPKDAQSIYIRYTAKAGYYLPPGGLNVVVQVSEKAPGALITVIDVASTELTFMPTNS